MPTPTTPPEPRDATPIANAQEFQAALLRVRDREGITPADLGLFRAFCFAPDHTLTAPKLAEAAGLSGWQEANLRFGTLAQRVGQALQFTPSRRSNGSLRWWMSVATGLVPTRTTPDIGNGFYVRSSWTRLRA